MTYQLKIKPRNLKIERLPRWSAQLIGDGSTFVEGFQLQRRLMDVKLPLIRCLAARSYKLMWRAASGNWQDMWSDAAVFDGPHKFDSYGRTPKCQTPPERAWRRVSEPWDRMMGTVGHIEIIQCQFISTLPQ